MQARVWTQLATIIFCTGSLWWAANGRKNDALGRVQVPAPTPSPESPKRE